MRRSRKQLEELVATTNSNLTKANLDFTIKVRRYDNGYTLHTNEGIETLCSGSLEKCDTYLRGINKAVQAVNFSKLIFKTDSYPQSGTASQYKVSHNITPGMTQKNDQHILDGDTAKQSLYEGMNHSHDDNELNLPYRGK